MLPSRQTQAGGENRTLSKLPTSYHSPIFERCVEMGVIDRPNKTKEHGRYVYVSQPSSAL